METGALGKVYDVRQGAGIGREEAELKLRLKIDGSPDRIVEVERDPYTLGRSSECDLSLPFTGISRFHARLMKMAPGVWKIEDMGSKNGIHLNGQLMVSPQLLKSGDVISLGEISLDVISAELPQRAPAQPSARGSETIILRNARELRQQWIQVGAQESQVSQHEKTIARLSDLVEIANALNSAVSIQAIFSQVQQVVFRYLKSIERLALLVDVNDSGQLELLNAARRNSLQQDVGAEGTWISRSICQQAFTQKVAIQTADAQMDGRFDEQQSIVSKGIRTAMAVPLWDEKRVVGILYADAHISSHHWSESGEEELRFFSALANLVAASVQRWLLTTKLRNDEKILQRLQRYHSPAVVEQMMTEEAFEGGRLPPKDSEISILFADIVRFTDLSERLAPDKIAELLNVFFEEMLQEVFAAGGTLDKFIGDCIMAFFGAPVPQTNHADRAATAAKGMLKRLKYLNASGMLFEPLQLRIAINSGRAVVGDVGSSQRVDYTALGASINLASRMQRICPPGACVVSGETYGLLSDREDWMEMGKHDFDGIRRPVRVYRLTLSNAMTGGC